MSADEWIGYTVSVDCGEVLGVYQGQICGVDAKEQTLTIKRAFRNGIPDPSSQVTLSAGVIRRLQIIQGANSDESTSSTSTVAVSKPVAKRPGRSISESTVLPKANQQRESPRKPFDDAAAKNITVPEGNKTPSKKDRMRIRMSERDEACFGPSIDNPFEHEFDFEKNLALFNKQAFYEELNASQRPDVVRQADIARRPQKYRHDENVIQSSPVTLRQLAVPAPDSKEYVTDDGLVIPSITPELRRQLFDCAVRKGFTWERQIELMGRAATELALQFLGGGHRLNPHNVHQLPNVAILCGPHHQGAMGINCGRQLASHGVKTFLYLHNSAKLAPPGFIDEVPLYRLTGNKMTSNIAELPTTAIDLIIIALADEVTTDAELKNASNWVSERRVPILSLDPPPEGTPGLDAKCSLLPMLPLAHSSSNGRLYLCNLTFPLKVFHELGIKYFSPFGPKFVIPLHPNVT